jgi:nicotinamidase/pyrazinamidase
MAAYETVFVDIDTQFDFMDPSGKLYVPGSTGIVDALERLFSFAARTRTPVISSVDDHAPDDPEFQQWPPHCVQGTPGQQKIPETILSRALVITPEQSPAAPQDLLREYDQLIFPKATLDAFDSPSFSRLVDNLNAGRYVVFGVATDYCVRLAAKGLLERGQRVQVVEDAIRAVAPETGEQARRELIDLGAEWVRTADVIAEAV